MKEFITGLCLLAISGVCTLLYNYTVAPAVGLVQEKQKLESGDYRINQYESYFNQCAAIEGYESTIEVQSDLLKTASSDDAQRIKTVIAGVTSQRARAIAQYNADVVKYTKNKYFDTSLPKFISIKGKTECVN